MWRRARAAAWDVLALVLVSEAALAWNLPRLRDGVIGVVAWATGGLVLALVAVAVLSRRVGRVGCELVAVLGLLALGAVWRVATPAAPTSVAMVLLIGLVVAAGAFGRKRTTAVAVAAVLAFAGPAVAPDVSLRPGDLLLLVVLCAVVGVSLQRLKEHERHTAPAAARLDAVLRAATGHSIIATDLAGRVTVFNTGAERLLGWSAAETVGRFGIDAFHDPDELALLAGEMGVAEGLTALLRTASLRSSPGQGAETGDWTYVARDRRRFTVSLAASEKRNGDGVHIGYIFLASDVTAAREATRALELQHRIQSTLVAHLPDTAVGLLDREQRWVAVGGHWPASMWSEPADPVGRRLGDTLAAEDGALLGPLVAEAWAHPVHRQLRSSAGHDIEVDALPVRGDGRQRLELLVVRDVTQRRREREAHRSMSAELGLRLSSFRSAFEHAPIGIVLVSIDDDGADYVERVSEANDAFAAMLRRPVSELAGVALDELLHPDDARTPLTVAVPEVGQVSQQRRLVSGDGRVIWCELTVSLVRDGHGMPSFYLCHVADLSQRVAAEQALLHALEQQRAATAALQETDRVRAQIVTTVSHELRTPLTSIAGYLELLGSGDAGPLNAGQRRMLEVIRANSLRLVDLVENLLTLSRLRPDQARAGRAEAVVVQDVVRASIESVQVLLAQRRHRLTVALPDVPATVAGDSTELQLAISNLLTNAARYTDPGGAVHVGVHVGEGDRSGVVRVEVRDSGIGIEEDDYAAIFDPFYRGRGPIGRAISGTGLGLAIVKGVAERHHAEIRVRSRPGTGSSFELLIPTGRDPAHPG